MGNAVVLDIVVVVWCVCTVFKNEILTVEETGICGICLANTLASSPSILLCVIATIRQGPKSLSVQSLARLLTLSIKNVFSL